jgi:hypothetical protein
MFPIACECLVSVCMRTVISRRIPLYLLSSFLLIVRVIISASKETSTIFYNPESITTTSAPTAIKHVSNGYAIDSNVSSQPQHPIDMFRGTSSVTGIGFRVIANGYNHYSIAARNPTEPPSFASVDNHLSWRHKRTPWASVYRTWFAALRRAKW